MTKYIVEQHIHTRWATDPNIQTEMDLFQIWWQWINSIISYAKLQYSCDKVIYNNYYTSSFSYAFFEEIQSLCLYLSLLPSLPSSPLARGVIRRSAWDNNCVPRCTCNNLIGQVSPAKHLSLSWLGDMMSLLSLSFCSILSSRGVPLTPVSFVPPGGADYSGGGGTGL